MFTHILRRILSLFDVEDRYIRFSMTVYLCRNRSIQSYEARFRKNLDTGHIEVFTVYGNWVTLDKVFKGRTLARIIRRANQHAEKAEEEEIGSV